MPHSTWLSTFPQGEKSCGCFNRKSGVSGFPNHQKIMTFNLCKGTILGYQEASFTPVSCRESGSEEGFATEEGGLSMPRKAP